MCVRGWWVVCKRVVGCVYVCLYVWAWEESKKCKSSMFAWEESMKCKSSGIYQWFAGSKWRDVRPATMLNGLMW